MHWDIEKCTDFSFFNHVYYINLHCNEENREKRYGKEIGQMKKLKTTRMDMHFE
ncbi:hypothetical protein PAECIP112173_00809 [Paenibacillus sp. JJ-100]|nr:hypothetical protein PAECIP112173_00809 [Paenibacillus sp. JJ-100]